MGGGGGGGGGGVSPPFPCMNPCAGILAEQDSCSPGYWACSVSRSEIRKFEYCRFHLRLNIAFCVRPLTLIDFNTKRVLTHAQWLTQFSNACEISSNLTLPYEGTCIYLKHEISCMHVPKFLAVVASAFISIIYL